jgi:hypothetical protein
MKIGFAPWFQIVQAREIIRNFPQIGFLRKYNWDLTESAGYDARRTVGRTPSSARLPMEPLFCADQGVGTQARGPAPPWRNWLRSAIFIRWGERAALIDVSFRLFWRSNRVFMKIQLEATESTGWGEGAVEMPGSSRAPRNRSKSRGRPEEKIGFVPHVKTGR